MVSLVMCRKQSVRAGKNDASDVRKIRAEILRQAAAIAESEASPLAVEYWNHACQRIAHRLEAQAACLEAEAEVAEVPATSAAPVAFERICSPASAVSDTHNSLSTAEAHRLIFTAQGAG